MSGSATACGWISFKRHGSWVRYCFSLCCVFCGQESEGCQYDDIMEIGISRRMATEIDKKVLC